MGLNVFEEREAEDLIAKAEFEIRMGTCPRIAARGLFEEFAEAIGESYERGDALVLVDKLKKELEETEEGFDEKVEELAEVKQKVEDLEDKLSDAKADLANAREDLEVANARIVELEARVAHLEKGNDAYPWDKAGES